MQLIIWGRRGGFATWVSEHSQVPGRLLAQDCRYHIANAAPLPLPGYWKDFAPWVFLPFCCFVKGTENKKSWQLGTVEKDLLGKKKISSEFVVSSLNNNNMSDNMLNIFSNKSSVFSWGKKPFYLLKWLNVRQYSACLQITKLAAFPCSLYPSENTKYKREELLLCPVKSLNLQNCDILIVVRKLCSTWLVQLILSILFLITASFPNTQLRQNILKERLSLHVYNNICKYLYAQRARI